MAIKFNAPGALYLKGTATAYLQDSNNNIVYASDKFQTANIASSTTLGEIRGGIGNPIQALIPTDSAMTVTFVAADFSLFAKAAQTGATLAYGAPVMVCQNVTASGTSISIDVTGGTPVAAAGSSDVICFVQEVGVASNIASDGTAYPISSAGAVSNFVATSGHTYKVWYYVNRLNAQIATVRSLFDPSVFRFTAVMAVYSNDGTANGGTHVGNLTVIIPRLKLGGDGGGITGDQTTNDTTSITGQALAADEAVVTADCDDCGGVGSPMAYYIYAPCDLTSGIEGVVAQVGGVITVPKSTTFQMQPRVVVNGELANAVEGTFSYALVGSISGTTVNATTGLITAGATTGDAEIRVTLTIGAQSWEDIVNLSVTA